MMQKQAYSNEAPMRRILPLLVLLVVVIALVLAAVSVLTSIWNVRDIPNWPDPSQLQGAAPALETTPQPALQAYLAQKAKIADGYSWVDEKQGVAHIPIELAMQALAQPDGRAAGEREAWLMGQQAEESRQPGKNAAARALQAADDAASRPKTDKEAAAAHDPQSRPQSRRARQAKEKP